MPVTERERSVLPNPLLTLCNIEQPLTLSQYTLQSIIPVPSPVNMFRRVPSSETSPGRPVPSPTGFGRCASQRPVYPWVGEKQGLEVWNMVMWWHCLALEAWQRLGKYCFVILRGEVAFSRSVMVVLAWLRGSVCGVVWYDSVSWYRFDLGYDMVVW